MNPSTKTEIPSTIVADIHPEFARNVDGNPVIILAYRIVYGVLASLLTTLVIYSVSAIGAMFFFGTIYIYVKSQALDDAVLIWTCLFFLFFVLGPSKRA